MSSDLDKATTRNFLDGLRFFLTTFDDQRDAAREDDAIALTESREHHATSIVFGDLVPRLQRYSFVVLLAVILQARIAVFCKTLRLDHGLSYSVDDMEGDFIARLRTFLKEVVELQLPAELWRWMEDLLLLSRCISDAAGNLDMMGPAERRRLHNVVQRRPGLALEPDDLLFSRGPLLPRQAETVLVIHNEFCLDAVTAAQGLFGYLYQHPAPGGS
ncbi:MAG: hypothetical protein AMS18_15235 [Gemmatimonas sp. SG8_17]|nr:MAG: hypothetical protein AMS18_15235 [Gemmatimonas sp. SG8_17]